MLQTIIGQIWQPMRDQLGLFRALASGGRIPGINLVLLPAAKCNSQFGIMEHFMMALAGAWLFLRVIYCDLAIEDNQLPASRKRSPISDIGWQQSKQLEQTATRTIHPEDEQNTVQELELNLQKEDLFYWGWHRSRRHQPILKFTLNQLETLLRLEQDVNNEDDYDDEDGDVDDQYRDEVDNSDNFFEYCTKYPLASEQEDFKAPGAL